MHKPQRREIKRFIHIDTSNLTSESNKSKYTIKFGENIPVQDYNNVIKLEFKTIQFEKDTPAKYVQFKIKNIDGDIDSTSSIQNACTICYLDPLQKDKPIVDFAGGIFNFDTMLSKLTKLDIEIFNESGHALDVNHSYVIEITYVEGNFY